MACMRRRARGAPQSQRGQSRPAERDASLHGSLSDHLAAGSRPRGRFPQARPRPLHRRCAERRRGAGVGAPRLPRLAHELHAFVPPAWTPAIASPSRDLRFVGRARSGHRRLAGNGGAIPRLPARRNRLQLRGRAIRLRRFDARGKPAVHRPLRRRGDAAPAHENHRRRDGNGRRCSAWAPLISSLSPTSLPELPFEHDGVKSSSAGGRRGRDLHRCRRLRRDHRGAPPRKDAHNPGAARHRRGEWGHQGWRAVLVRAPFPSRHDRCDQHHFERTGAPCALLTTQGFRDIYEIGRVNRPESYNLFFCRHQPLIERDLRYEIRERMDAHGRVLIELDEDQVRAAVADAVRQGVEAIAILFLHSYRNPAHEQRVRAIIEASHPHLFVTASHELSQEYREFERTSTAAANAYIGPRVRRYLGEIGDHLEAAGFDGDFLIVQSTGGLFGVEEAQSACIRMLESGPAAGVIGTKALCDRIGLRNAIAFDMGGTTAKAGVIHDGDVLMTGSALIGGYATGLPVQIPMIDIQEVGTGGGSLARIDMGALHVGPESAGAAPGPVCYGLGGAEPTITDANLILGRLGADRFLGGEIKLDAEGARRALEARVATPLGLDLTAAADGILRIATTKMSHMVRWVTTECGLDAGEFHPRR